MKRRRIGIRVLGRRHAGIGSIELKGTGIARIE